MGLSLSLSIIKCNNEEDYVSNIAASTFFTILSIKSKHKIVVLVQIVYLPNPSSRTMALGSTQPLTEISTRNLPGGKERPARKADKLTAICEPTV
jgi:hypothetical protein